MSGETDSESIAADGADGKSPDTTEEAHGRRPGRRGLVRTLLIIATLLSVIGVFAIWANRQLLNADNWSNTSSALLQDTAIRTQVAGYLVDQLYANVNVAGELQAALPPQLKPLAGPVAGGLRNLAERAAFEALGRPRIQAAWKTAQRVTAQQFINIVEGKSKLVLLNGNSVFVDLRPIAAQLATRLGLPSNLVQSIPADAGRLKVMTSQQISTVQSAVSLVKGLAIILPAVAVVLFGIAVYLAEGRRRWVLMLTGIDLVIAGALVLIARNVAGNQIIGSLVSTDAVKPAAEATWSIGTAMLSAVAQATIIIGLAVMLAAWMAGPTRLAIAFRRSVAPWFRERVGVTYGTAAALLLLIVLWGPIPATRKPIPVLIIFVLVGFGVESLRRQTAEEFPDARMGDTLATVRERIRRMPSFRARVPPRAPMPPIAGGSDLAPIAVRDDRLERLERLAALRAAGALTDEEFAGEKARELTQPDG